MSSDKPEVDNVDSGPSSPVVLGDDTTVVTRKVTSRSISSSSSSNTDADSDVEDNTTKSKPQENGEPEVKKVDDTSSIKQQQQGYTELNLEVIIVFYYDLGLELGILINGVRFFGLQIVMNCES